MAEPREYEYEPAHVSEKEVLERFSAEKSRNPNAIVTLDELACGHWTVAAYDTPAEKEEFIQSHLLSALKIVTKMLRNPRK